MTSLTDATFIIDALRGRAYAAQLVPTLLENGLALSIITHMELWEGVYGNPNRRVAERRLREFLRPIALLPFSPRVSQRTAQLRRELRRLRRPLEQRALDILVAGTALYHGLTIVTSDADFDDIPGLTILNPRTGQTRRNSS
jgi:predicted nucleic acid-binding protein